MRIVNTVMNVFLLLLLLMPTIVLAQGLEVTVKDAPVREKADFSSLTLGYVQAGERLEILEKSDQWYKIRAPESGLTGYIYHIHVSEIGGSAPAVPATVKNSHGDGPAAATGVTQPEAKAKPAVLLNTDKNQKQKVKDKFFLMGLGMLRLNWTNVEGDAIRFRYSDLGLPTELSTRERASFMINGTFGNGRYSIDGHLDYDPENRITEPPLEFLLNVGNDNIYLSAGDYRMGVMMDTVFSRYYHPFRGGLLGAKSKAAGVELLGGLARGESGIEEFPADLGSGPYYLGDSPVLRGSEIVYLITKSTANPDVELKRTPLLRNQDYFIDYDRGSILFSYSIYPYDELGNPVHILVSYQFESLAGRFSRAVFGMRAFVVPFTPVKLTFSYIADADKNLDFGDILKNARSIYTFGLNLDSRPAVFAGEFSFSKEPETANHYAMFGGGIVTMGPKVKLHFNGWKLDEEFPTFANKQLQYGFSLFQIFPSYAERNIYLSPFQFTRNLGAELYPFTLSRLSVNENELHGFAEWEDKSVRISAGYGSREETTSKLQTNTLYASGFYNRDATKIWGKAGLENTADPGQDKVDAAVLDVLLGVRQRIKKFSGGELIFQADIKSEWIDDYLDLYTDTYHQTWSVSGEFLNGREGFFASWRKDLVKEQVSGVTLQDADIFEAGVLRHIYKGFFVDSRYRREEAQRSGVNTKADIISLGAGWESQHLRAMGRYEIQTNETAMVEGKRKLWSLFFFGAPVKRMSLNVRYYRQEGQDNAPFSLSERSEEQLSLRFLWRPWDFLNLYSQWRYDTNLELLPPLNHTKSNSMAQVHGIKIEFAKRLEFLANYKLIKVWGPIENRKYAAAAELGYLLFRHFRIGVGGELIDFNDRQNPAANYRSTVGYFKLVAVY